jgi:uncharacterized membrane protein YcaP (DUF421 family)
MRWAELPDWDKVFVPDLSLAESFLRGTLVFFGVFVLFRVVLKRQAGGIGLPDIMLVLLVAEAASNALAADYKSVPNGLVVVAALLFWSYALDRATHHWPWLDRRVQPRPVELVRDGRVIRENLDAEQMTDEELAEQLRLNGVESPAGAKRVTLEPGGEVSVIPKEEPGLAGSDGPAGPGARAPPPPRPPEPRDAPPDFDRAMDRFLAAARDLRAAVEWHEARAAEHRQKAEAAREALARHGVRGRKWLDPAAEPAAVRHDPQPEPSR